MSIEQISPVKWEIDHVSGTVIQVEMAIEGMKIDGRLIPLLDVANSIMSAAVQEQPAKSPSDPLGIYTEVGGIKIVNDDRGEFNPSQEYPY